MFDVVERGLVLKLVLQVSAGDLVIEHPAGILERQPRFNIGSHLSHGLLHVNQVRLLRHLRVHLAFVGLGRQYLLQLLYQLYVMIEHLMHGLK